MSAAVAPSFAAVSSMLLGSGGPMGSSSSWNSPPDSSSAPCAAGARDKADIEVPGAPPASTSLGPRPQLSPPAHVPPATLVGAKAVEIRGAKGTARPELDGVYHPLQETWAGAPIYRNGRTKVHLVWNLHPPRWRAVPSRGSAETLAFADCAVPAGAGASPPPPDRTPTAWRLAADGALGAAEVPLECVFHGKTVVVSGRSGHNERLNGVYNQVPEDYGGYPVYADKERGTFMYRRLGAPVWVIGNRLGPSLRGGRGSVFAEATGDTAEPYLVKSHWTVAAWGGRPAQEDPAISVFPGRRHGYAVAAALGDAPAAPDATGAPAADGEDPERAAAAAASGGGAAAGGVAGCGAATKTPAELLLVRARTKPALSGAYILETRSVNGRALYRRPNTDDFPERYIFWEGECWCIGKDPSMRRKQCDAATQRRVDSAFAHPEDAVWSGAEVLRSTISSAARLDATLLSSLRGRTSALVQRFEFSAGPDDDAPMVSTFSG